MTNQGAIFIRTASIYQNKVAHTIDTYTKGIPLIIINYEGQKHGTEDFKLTSLIKRDKPIHVFARGAKEKSYKYLGCSIRASIVKERKVPSGRAAESADRLQVQLILEQGEKVPVPHDIEYAYSNPYSAKYKHDCLAMLGAREYVTGESTEEGKFCSRNLVVGFFGW